MIGLLEGALQCPPHAAGHATDALTSEASVDFGPPSRQDARTIAWEAEGGDLWSGLSYSLRVQGFESVRDDKKLSSNSGGGFGGIAGVAPLPPQAGEVRRARGQRAALTGELRGDGWRAIRNTAQAGPPPSCESDSPPSSRRCAPIHFPRCAGADGGGEWGSPPPSCAFGAIHLPQCFALVEAILLCFLPPHAEQGRWIDAEHRDGGGWGGLRRDVGGELCLGAAPSRMS